jgi:ring-1,2-phenylacetyl-CoA epoxidase subunit PaaC
MSEERVGLLLALGDDELILGHRLSEWTGWVPYVEEDLALSSIAQDEIAHARALYELAAGVSDSSDVDALALGRQPSGYRNAVICERGNRDFSYTIARQYLYDTADGVRLEALASSSFKDLAQLAVVLALEERYHVDHARSWFERLANGPVEARSRFADALTATIGEAMALFEPLPEEAALLADGTLPRSHEEMLGSWLAGLGAELERVGLERVLSSDVEAPVGELLPTSSGAIEATEPSHTLRVPDLARRDGRWVHVGEFAGAGGRRGRHSEDFAPLWEEMTALYRGHPGATW